MKHFINIVIAFFFCTSASNGQFNNAFQADLEEYMIYLEQEADPVGLSISIRSGDHEWNDVIGISSVDERLSTSSIFGMASLTKTFVSAAILKLMEEDKLSLSDPLHLYLPSYDNIDSTITIKELLNHTSGIFDYTKHPEYWDIVFGDQYQFYRFSPEEVIELGVLAKEFDKGTDQKYSNTNYTLLGMIITQIAGRPYYEEIFDLFNVEENYPSITCPPFTSEISELANIWSDSDQGLQNISTLGIGFDGVFSSNGAVGSFVGTPADISQWGYDLYSGKLLSESSMDSLFDFHPFLLDGETEYGLGVWNITSSCDINVVGHDGYLLYTSFLSYSEEYDLSIALMTNDNGSDFREFGGLGRILDEVFCIYQNSLITSSEDILDHEEVNIYPNPLSNMLNIDLPPTFDRSVQVEVYNEIGTLVYAQKMQNQNQQALQIDFTELARGLYFIKIFDSENIFSKKLFKE